jgi:protein ImuB
MRIVAANEVALAFGIGPGLGLADARARIPDLHTVPHALDVDARLLESIADDCERYTPSVALDPPDGLILDITGCAHIWDDEDGLLSDLAARLAHAGFTLKLALAETPDKARALARHGGEWLSVRRGTPRNQMNDVRSADLVSLPIVALDLDEEQTTALRRAGLNTIDDLARRPRKPLAARFGMAMVTKLARVLGEEDARVTPRRALPAITVLRRFAEPVARSDDVLEVIGRLVEEAGVGLRERGEGGRRFSIRLFRSDGDVRRLAIDTGSPTRDPALLVRLFRERIDALADPLDPGFGYDAIRLDVPLSEPLSPEQSGLEREQTSDLNGLIDRLAVRLGGRRVQRFASGNSYIPELAGLTDPAQTPPFPMPWPEPETGEPPLRPLHLFDPPQPVEVVAEVPDGPPRKFRWRRNLYEIVAHEGPERIVAEWWKRRDGHKSGKGGLTRDYYRVEDTQGRRFWLFRHGLYGSRKPNPDWYLHGRFA